MPTITTRGKTGTKNIRVLISEAAQEILSDSVKKKAQSLKGKLQNQILA